MKKPDIILVDGSSYLYRAYHALPNLTTSAGEPTGALHGVLAMIAKLVREYPDSRVVVTFDAPGKTFRSDIYADYKANRPPMPDDLRVQVEPIRDAVRAMGLPLLSIEGVEADDVIGTLCAQATRRGSSILVSSGDKDLAQLIDDGVSVMDTMFDKTLDAGGVREKFGVDPEQVTDFLALVGDPSDNIPGVPKVGAKTAAKWLNEYGDLASIIANADAITGKVGESLREHLGQLEVSKALATIRRDVDLDFVLEDLEPGEPDFAALKEIYAHYELRSLAKQLGDAAPKAEGATTPGDYETVLDRDAFERWFEAVVNADLVALDTETTSINYTEAELVGISLSVEPGRAAYIPLAHDYEGAPRQLPREEVLDRLRGWLEDANAAKVGHHLKYDAHVLANYGIELSGMAYDSMLESYVLNSVATRHDMDSVARVYLGRETIRYEDVAGKGAKQLTFDKVDLDVAAPYAAEDADVTLQLHRTLWKSLAGIPSLKKVYEEIEQPLVPVLFAMEEAGVLIDRDMLARQSGELENKMQALETMAHELAGGEFNLGSPKQLQEILFGRLELPVVRKTPGGQPSTAEDVLVELAADFELPQVIIDYRAVSKLRSTYTDKLPRLISERTGRVHTSYHQAVAATGRLSSSDPNLQNIPIRTPEGRRIRQAFVPPPGQRLVAADYSQIELRIMAHLSGDEGLVEAFRQGLDVHRATAAEVFGVSLDDVSDNQRRSAKAINFGLMYGMSAFGLARQLGIGRGEAQDYVDLYFERYPGVKAFMDGIRDKAREDGYVETVSGRRLYLPEINARNAQRRQYAERSAINAPMQGTAADIIKRAMLAAHDWLGSGRIDARMIMQVHDELVFEVAEAAVDDFREKISDIMAAAASLSVPLAVDVGEGSNWDEAH